MNNIIFISLVLAIIAIILNIAMWLNVYYKNKYEKLREIDEMSLTTLFNVLMYKSANNLGTQFRLKKTELEFQHITLKQELIHKETGGYDIIINDQHSIQDIEFKVFNQ